MSDGGAPEISPISCALEKKEERDVSPVGDDRRCRRRASCSVSWWCGEAETEANGDRGWSCGGVEKKRLPCEGKKLWLLLGFF